MIEVAPNALRVFVVDEDDCVRRLLCGLLKLLGYAAREVDSGKAVLELAAESPPDAVLLDIGMPGMAGYEVARRLRQLPGASRILLAAVTADVDEDAVSRSREVGFDIHLFKPVGMEMLEALLRNHELTRC